MKQRSAWAAVAALLTLALAGCGGGGGSPALRNGAVAGRVVDDLGRALSGVTVSVGTITATSRTDGTYKLAAVPAGARTVQASRSGYSFASAAVTVPAGGSVTANFTGTRDNHPPTVRTSASPTLLRFVGGQVNLAVTVSDPDRDQLIVRLTSSGGALALTNAGGGRYTATVQLPPNRTLVDREYVYVGSAFDGRTTTQDAITITVPGVTAPDGVDGGTDPGDGGPPVPGI